LCFQTRFAIELKGDSNLSYRLPDQPDHFRSRSLRRRQLIDLQLSPNGSSQLSSRTESAQRERQRRQDVSAQKTPEESSEKTSEETLDGLQQAYETLREERGGMSAGQRKGLCADWSGEHVPLPREPESPPKTPFKAPSRFPTASPCITDQEPSPYQPHVPSILTSPYSSWGHRDLYSRRRVATEIDW
jgi:hypothetical protein